MSDIGHWSLKTKIFNPYIIAEKVFNNKECDAILDYCNGLDLSEAEVTDSDDSSVDNNLRKSSIAWLTKRNDITEFLYKKLTDCIVDVNKKFWNYNIEYIPTLQYTKYHNIGDNFNYHIDISQKSADYRKLTFSVQLNDSSDYDGCDLILKLDDNGDIPLSRRRGDINFFPSFLLHKVTPLQRGERNCIVGWVCGPPFR